jgi:hypothetical protein
MGNAAENRQPGWLSRPIVRRLPSAYRPTYTVEGEAVCSSPEAIRAQLVRNGVLVPRELVEQRSDVIHWHSSPATLRLLGSEEERQSVLSGVGYVRGERGYPRE